MDDMGVDEGVVGVFILARDQPPDDAGRHKQDNGQDQPYPYPGIFEGTGFLLFVILILARIIFAALVAAVTCIIVVGSSITGARTAVPVPFRPVRRRRHMKIAL